MRWRPIARVALWLGGVLLALELLYVIAANLLIFSGVIQREASKPLENVNLAWDRAYTFWPVRAYVSGFRMRVQDGVQQFGLTVDHAKVDIDLWDLVHRTFHASWVRADGVHYLQVVKVAGVAGLERRLAAFPTIEGFPRPALQAKTSSRPPTPEELAKLWSVELDDVDAHIDELWFLEYRYRGPAHVQGGFALSPLRSLWVGPALLELEGGQLTAGEHTVSASFTARANVTVGSVDLAASKGLHVLHTLTSSIQLDTTLDDLGVADLYVEGLRAQGKGKLSANVEIDGARLVPGSTLGLSLPASDVRIDGYRFSGASQVKLVVPESGKGLAAHATLGGELRVPPFEKDPNDPVEIALSDVTADLALAGDDVSAGIGLQRLAAAVGEARVAHAKAIARAFGSIASCFAKLVFGDGPLVASATAYVTPEYELVRLQRATLGNSELSGAAVAGAHGWTGAAAGQVGGISLGLRLQDGKLSGVPLVSAGWLDAELAKAGIQPQ